MTIGRFIALVVCCSWTAQAQVAVPPGPVEPKTERKTLVFPPDDIVPTISDVAAACENPAQAPVITVTASDDGGVVGGYVHVRPLGGGAVEDIALSAHQADAGSATLMAKLRDGLQTTGFSYWVDVVDGAGNVARLGAADRALDVAAAREPTPERLAREAAESVRSPVVHPSLVMLAFGTGVVGVAGAGIFLLDRSVAEGRLVDARTSEETKRLQDASIQDLAAGVVLGVVGGIGLATGVTLLLISVADE